MNEQETYEAIIQKTIMEALPSSEPIICKNCSNGTFEQVSILRRISSLALGRTSPTIAPIPVFVCNSCGTTVAELLPKFLQNPTNSPPDPTKEPKPHLTLVK
jgi:hypothetical protein